MPAAQPMQPHLLKQHHGENEMTTTQVCAMLSEMNLQTEWHVDLDQPITDYLAELADEIIGMMHWPVRPYG